MNLSDFRNDFSTSAFKTIDGSRRIVGKFCDIELLDDGVCDIWLVRPDRESISNRKLTSLIRGIEVLPEYSLAGRPLIRRLIGEAYLQTTDRELILKVALLAGVKRKRRVSEFNRRKQSEHLAGLRLRMEAD